MFRTAIALTSILVSGAHALAVPFTFEGTMDFPNSTATNAAGQTSVTFTCGGVWVRAQNGATVIQSPTRPLTIDELTYRASIDKLNWIPPKYSGFLDPGTNPMSGKARDDFHGGTCIVDGDTANGGNGSQTAPYLADIVAVEVAESVNVGVVTSASPLAINGMLVEPFADDRANPARSAPGFWKWSPSNHPTANVKAYKPSNQFPASETILTDEGFGLASGQALVGGTGAAVGYFTSSKPTKMYAYELSAEGPIERTKPRTSITRAQCTLKGPARDVVEVRGFCVLGQATSATVQAQWLDSSGLIPTWRNTAAVACTAIIPSAPTSQTQNTAANASAAGNVINIPVAPATAVAPAPVRIGIYRVTQSNITFNAGTTNPAACPVAYRSYISAFTGTPAAPASYARYLPGINAAALGAEFTYDYVTQ